MSGAKMRSKIAYLGPPSSYTHQAALSLFGDDNDLLEPTVSISDVFEAVHSGSVTYGVVPFENSANGSVVYTLDLLIDREKRFSGIEVCGETYIDVHHCLLGFGKRVAKVDEAPESGSITPTMNAPNPESPRTRPLSDLRHIRRIYSHPQAFGQCEAFLSTYLKGVERQEVSSTSKAAEVVAADSLRTSAAISSELAANVHGLKVLARGIEDREDNMTRFFILKQGDSNPLTVSLDSAMPSQPATQEKWKNLIAFRVDHQSSGALAKSLSVFGSHDLNLTSINSRPSREHPWHYVFLVEFSDERRGGRSEQVNAALNELSTRTQGWKWLGSWIDKVPIEN
ncbi:MAG: hypothetical protein Q9191_005143 [Dirinaria sp. TL-2023a]